MLMFPGYGNTHTLQKNQSVSDFRSSIDALGEDVGESEKKCRRLSFHGGVQGSGWLNFTQIIMTACLFRGYVTSHTQGYPQCYITTHARLTHPSLLGQIKNEPLFLHRKLTTNRCAIPDCPHRLHRECPICGWHLLTTQ